jgi:hypothetical protein
MSTITECVIYSKDLKPGDAFSLKPTNKTVISIVKTPDKDIPIEMNTTRVWMVDVEKTKEGKKEFKHNYDDWHGKL